MRKTLFKIKIKLVNMITKSFLPKLQDNISERLENGCVGYYHILCVLRQFHLEVKNTLEVFYSSY